jgi:predicted nucleic acid-binding protein
MTAKVFLDTNVLVYAAIGTGKDERKRQRALALIESGEFGTSAQVLQEFFVTMTRKAVRPLSAAQALEWIEQLTAFPCCAIDHRIVRIAIEQSDRHESRIGMRPFFGQRRLWHVRPAIRRTLMTDSSIQVCE